MKNCAIWKPSKFVYVKGRLKASKTPNEVCIGSRLIANQTAKFYDQWLKRHAKGKLLDLGCGKVPFFLVYRDLVREVVCVDWKNTLHPNDYIDLHWDLTKPLPFADGEFDTIILSDVLEHIPTPDDLWKEMSRILAHQGTIIMNVPFYYWVHEQPNDYYRYTEFALRRFVANAGLRLVELKPIGGLPEIVADLFAKMALNIPLLGGCLARFVQGMAMVYLKTGFGRQHSRATRNEYPLGYFLVAQKDRLECGDTPDKQR